MNIARYCIENRVFSWLLIIIILLGGQYAFEKLGRFEDPEFTIKDAMVFTLYPGASPKEVEEEVTDRIETAIQQLGQVEKITSVSKAGISEITVTIRDQYNAATLPQVWDELRRKVNDAQRNLPPGAGPSLVNDDFGDVFGIYFAITGPGFNYKELKDITKDIRKELLLVPGVAKVDMSGILEEQIFIELSQAKLSQLGISPHDIYKLLESHNLVLPSGTVTSGIDRIRISPTGELNSLEAIGDLLITKLKSKAVVYLRDIAQISRGYEEIPTRIIRFNQQPAITLGVSLTKGGNVVKLGEAIQKKLNSLQERIPIGISINKIYDQPVIVDQSVSSFIINLVEAIVIVIAVLLIFMGLRSGLLIGAILLLTVYATLLIMYMYDISLQRISLGALIIALGMLVDNALVIVDGMLVRIQQGQDAKAAGSEIVGQTIWPLFGATVVAILAFAGIGLSDDSTGEYVNSLFYVILISLSISWFLAITITPLFGVLYLKPGNSSEEKDVYSGSLYQIYKNLLIKAVHYRSMTLGAMFILLVISMIGFNYIKPGFFPDSTTPMFFVDYWKAEGTDIRDTSKDLKEIEAYVRKLDNVTNVTTFVGKGATRFMLVYTPEQANSSYGQLAIEVNDYRNIDELSENILNHLAEKFPNSEPKAKKIRLGPGRDAKIEVRFSGTDPVTLRRLSNQAQEVMHQDPGLINIRDNWRHKVKLYQPVFSENLAKHVGITRMDLKQTLQMSFSGLQVGLYRESDELIPIISRLPLEQRSDIGSIKQLFIWSPITHANVPIQQVVNGFETNWEDARVHRRNRKMTITASCDPASEPAGTALTRLQPKIEEIPLPAGYELEWGGEYEDQNDAQMALAQKLPLSFLLMIIVVVLLFNRVKQPVIIWLTVPLSIIGVTFGLLITNRPFDFMGLLGFLSLTGMMIKNAIVLIDQIDFEISSGKERYTAVIDSSISRVRPVSMAALTTVLGMTPLLFDAFFVNMAVLIMFGLTFATLLTLFVVPILYTVFFKIKETKIVER